jgi:hypothetical protein
VTVFVSEAAACGNPSHPAGPGHPARTLPTTRRERKNFEANKAKWGCGCDWAREAQLEEAIEILRDFFGTGTWKCPSEYKTRVDVFLAKVK